VFRPDMFFLLRHCREGLDYLLTGVMDKYLFDNNALSYKL